MSEMWPVKTLGEIATVLGGSSAPQGEHLFEDGIYPFIRTADVGQVKFGEILETKDHLNELGIKKLRHFKKGTILIPKSGASTFLNHRVIMGMDAYVASHLAGIKADDAIVEARYLLYALSRIKAQDLLQENAYPSLNLSLIKEIEIPVPPMLEQQRIVSILDEAFEKIEESIKKTEKQSISSLDNYRSASKSIFEESGGDWVKTTLGQICTLQRGFDLPKRLRVQGEFPLVSASGVIDTHNMAKVTGPGVTTGRSGTIGKVNYIEDDFWPLNTTLYVKDFHGNHPRFIYHFLLEFGLERFAGGTGVPTLNRNLVHPVEVIIPSNIEEQIAIADKLDLLKLETKNYQTTLAEKQSSIIELKQSILQEAFSGKLTGGITA